MYNYLYRGKQLLSNTVLLLLRNKEQQLSNIVLLLLRNKEQQLSNTVLLLLRNKEQNEFGHVHCRQYNGSSLRF